MVNLDIRSTHGFDNLSATATNDRGAHFPTDLVDVVRFGDGRRVTIRPLLPQDAEPQQAFVRNLSAQARYHRFMSPIRELTPAMLDRLMQVDHRNHVALVAEAFAQGNATMVAEARYVRDANDNAEFAIAVADAWQGQGLGRLLLRKLECIAAAAGVRRIVADTLRVNAAMLGLARRAGYTTKASPDGGWQVRLEKVIEESQGLRICGQEATGVMRAAA